MKKAEKLFFNRKTFPSRQLRDDYLNTVNIKLISPSGHEQYVRQGCHHHEKVMKSFGRTRIIHEPCFVPPESNDKRPESTGKKPFQRQKPPKNDEGNETWDRRTDGKRCSPLELRRQYVLNHRRPSGAPVRFASETAFNEKSIKREYGSLSVKTPQQLAPFRDSIKKLSDRNESYIHADRLHDVHEQTPMHEMVDNTSNFEFKKKMSTFPASTHRAAIAAAVAAAEARNDNIRNSATTISPEAIYLSAVDNQFHEASCPFARFRERHNHRRAADSSSRRHEQHDDTEHYWVKEKRSQAR
ncbi:hypothetical protein BsWGS_08002 [Bradybaena similaris]